MTKVTERDRFLMSEAFKAGDCQYYATLDNWLNDIISDGGHTVEMHILHDAEAMTAAQDSREPSFWTWEYMDGAIEQNAIYKSKEQCERHSQADKGKAIPFYLAAPNAVQVDNGLSQTIYEHGGSRIYRDSDKGGGIDLIADTYSENEELAKAVFEFCNSCLILSTGGD